MYCPFCNAEETKVTDSRLVGAGMQVRRRRECLHCHERFTTYEKVELVLPQIIKRDGRRVAFDENKLRGSMQVALRKRPISRDQIEGIISSIKKRMRESGERELHSLVMGEWIMEELKSLDDIAYVRFASVYRRFQDIADFNEEVAKIKERHGEGALEVTEA